MSTTAFLLTYHTINWRNQHEKWTSKQLPSMLKAEHNLDLVGLGAHLYLYSLPPKLLKENFIIVKEKKVRDVYQKEKVAAQCEVLVRAIMWQFSYLLCGKLAEGQGYWTDRLPEVWLSGFPGISVWLLSTSLFIAFPSFSNTNLCPSVKIKPAWPFSNSCHTPQWSTGDNLQLRQDWVDK